MSAASPTIFSSLTTDKLLLWINRSLEALWLLTVVLVPLAFVSRDYLISSSAIAYLEVPKIAVLRTLVALMAVLWLAEWGIKGGIPLSTLPLKGNVPEIRPGVWLPSAFRWLSAEPVRWVGLAVVVFAVSVIISTAFSKSFSVSAWGRIPGEDGYATYTVASYFILFGVITAHLKTRQQLWRLLGAIVTVALLVAAYSMLQHYDHDFLSLIEPARTPGPFTAPRATSTVGNAILVGAVLLMTMAITLMGATITLNLPVRSREFWLKVVLWGSILTVLMLGLIFTLGRGAWGGTTVAVIAYLGMLLVFIGWRTWLKVVLLLLIVGASTWAVIEVPSYFQGNSDTEVTKDAAVASMQSSNQSSRSSGASTVVVAGEPAPSILAEISSKVADRIAAVGSEFSAGGFAGRFEIWRNSWDLMIDRPWFGFGSLAWPNSRLIIGYGPDLFRYTYLLESQVRPVDRVPGEPAHAHNYFIHQGVETGFFGLLASLGLFVSVFIVGAFQYLRRKESITLAHKLVLAGLLAALAGRFVEQMVGLARVSDLTIFWVLLAIFVTLPRTMANSESSEVLKQTSKAAVSNKGTQTLASGFKNSMAWMRLGQLAFVVLLIVGIGAFTWVKTINYVRAGVIAAQADELAQKGDLQGSLTSISRAIDLAPDVPPHYIRRANIYAAILGSDNIGFETRNGEQGCSVSESGWTHEVCLATQSYDGNRVGSQHRPLDFRARIALAESALDLVRLTADKELADEVLRYYKEVTQLVPQSWPLHNGLAAAYLELGQQELAIEAAEESLAINNDTDTNFQALIVKGLAYLQLGRLEKALAAFDQVIRIKPYAAVAFNDRGMVYQAMGDSVSALQDFDEAIEIDEHFAEAQNNRGLIYLGLGQPGVALLNFDGAIRLDPNYAAAYNNRGLARAALGQYELAVREHDRAIQLNPGYAQAYINRGVAYLNLGQPGRVLEDSDRAIGLRPSDGRAYALRALGNTLLGEDTLAQQDADRATQLGFNAGELERRIMELRNQR